MSRFQVSQINTPIVVSSGTPVWLELIWSDKRIFSINFTLQKRVPTADVLPKQWLEPFELYWVRPLDKVTQKAWSILPIDFDGTLYQQRVWAELQHIPAGKTVPYGLISDTLKSSPRAVAAACKANPVVLAVPCHRVVSKSGIGGFMGMIKGDAIDIKKWLINHEQ